MRRGAGQRPPQTTRGAMQKRRRRKNATLSSGMERKNFFSVTVRNARPARDLAALPTRRGEFFPEKTKNGFFRGEIDRRDIKGRQDHCPNNPIFRPRGSYRSSPQNGKTSACRDRRATRLLVTARRGRSPGTVTLELAMPES